MRADVVGHHRQVKRVILFDHDGVLVDTEPWYFEAGRRALATIGLPLDQDQYLADMTTSGGTWARARASRLGMTGEPAAGSVVARSRASGAPFPRGVT